jgi:Trp operon repressor
MATLTLELTLDQLIAAIERLSLVDRLRIVRTILKDYREEINQRFDESLAKVHAAHPNLNEDEVMAEINQLVHEIRAGPHGQSGS